MDCNWGCGGGFDTVLLGMFGWFAGLFVGGVAFWLLARRVRALAAVCRTRLWPALAGWHGGRRLAAMTPIVGTDGLAPGTRARLRGVVQAGPPEVAPLSGAPSVVTSHVVGERGAGILGHGASAHDFLLRLADGTPVRVLAGAAAEAGALRLIDTSPHRWPGKQGLGAWFCESRIAAGDAIEAAGELARALDPGADRLRDREPPLVWTLGAGRGTLLLRFGTRETPDAPPSPALAAR